MKLRSFLAGGMAALAISATSFVLASPAGAVAQTRTLSQAFTGSTNPGVSFNTTAVCDACFPDILGPGPGSWAFGASVTTSVSNVKFTSSAGTAVNYDDALLRQGQTLPISDTLTAAPGTIMASGTLNLGYGVYNDPLGGTNFAPVGTITAANKPFAVSFACAMPLPGDPPANCTSGVLSVPIASIVLIPAIYPVPGLSIDLSVHVTLHVTVNGSGVATVRSAQVVGGSGAATAPLTFGGTNPSTVPDSLVLSCLQPAGNDVNYSFTGTTYTPQLALSTTTAVHFEATTTGVPIFPPPATVDIGLFGGDLGSVTNSPAPVPFTLNAPDQTVDLGVLAKNNIPPVVVPGHAGLYSGTEGQPVVFDGTGSSSVCGFPTLRWDFSDGGVAFGPMPSHTFGGSGSYSGLLTATDATGLTSQATFSVSITNLPPVVHAGPATAAAWGIPVALNGSATDPGTDDQSTLTYRWDFGDGTPSATGGASVSHVYSTPRLAPYVATLTSCDRFGACASATTTVSIRARATTAAYLGDSTGTYNTPAAMRASLTDEFGLPVQGRTVVFSYNGTPVATATTDALGLATSPFTPGLDAGTYPVAVSFAGDTLYTASSAAGTFAEAKKATSVTYTGALAGGPNKTVTLSAVLRDATGLPLAGRTISFVLGAQTVAAVTDANGVATAALQLNQKNGTYPLTATFVPTGTAPAPTTDPNRYTGSAAVTTFGLQVK